MSAVAAALNIPLRGATIKAEGDLDFRGTLGVSKDAPVGFKEIRLNFDLDTDAILPTQHMRNDQDIAAVQHHLVKRYP